MLKQVYGYDTVTFKPLYTWFKKFIDGRESFEDEHGSGRPTTADNARWHNTTLVKPFLIQHGDTELSHPLPRIPHTCHYRTFMFPKLKVALKGRRFTHLMHTETAVTRELKAVPVEEFSKLLTICTHVVKSCKVYDEDYFDY
ncbi:hypothetical protein AVEN_54626-1 [Araneus ventricosus]|uniref:Mos1 transposase HTH domain-containing protein n=1 Tax=Araneus ventricosus TaxID=182803 RepID=A0A4Y2BMQ1_ARAVE|nr:hypothetical protein AVEN_54626-1 [Araneus ventricosus]